MWINESPCSISLITARIWPFEEQINTFLLTQKRRSKSDFVHFLVPKTLKTGIVLIVSHVPQWYRAVFYGNLQSSESGNDLLEHLQRESLQTGFAIIQPLSWAELVVQRSLKKKWSCISTAKYVHPSSFSSSSISDVQMWRCVIWKMNAVIVESGGCSFNDTWK